MPTGCPTTTLGAARGLPRPASVSLSLYGRGGTRGIADLPGLLYHPPMFRLSPPEFIRPTSSAGIGTIRGHSAPVARIRGIS
jgi:hypothetical protein